MKNNRTITFLSLILLALLLFFYTSSFRNSAVKIVFPYDSLYSKNDVSIFSIKNDPWVEKVLSEMTLEEKAGQVVFPFAKGSFTNRDNPEYLRLKKLVEEYKVGGLIFFQSEIMEEVYLTNEMQKIAKIPLLISADFERGVAQRVTDATLFPYNMGVGAANDTSLTYQMGRVIAEEGLTLGVHHNYAPVVDLNDNPANPIINVRSFGEDKNIVSDLGIAFFRGVQDGEMIATAKHFPGHGNIATDSHNELPVINSNKDYLFNNELYPFKKLIDAGVMSVMVSHLAMPSFEPDKKIPATLSYKIVTDLLKKKLGFKGLIVTDAMNMKAITNSFTDTESSVMALKAGNDCILYPENPEECIIAITNALRSGEISEERINESIRKILTVKRWKKLDMNRIVDPEMVMSVIGKNSHWELARKIARKSITLVKNEKNIIPLKSTPSLKYAHLIIQDNKRGESGEYFHNELKKRAPFYDEIIRVYPNTSKSEFRDIISTLKKADVILLSVYLKVRAYQGSIGITNLQRELINSVINLKKPLVMLSHGNPYILGEFPSVQTYVCNYGDPEVSEMALCEAIFGEIPFYGKLPVSIPQTKYKVGFGLELPSSALQNIESLNYDGENMKFPEVDNLINNAIKDSAFPAAVLLIAQNGKVLYKKPFGNLTYDKNSATTETSTIFDLASVSKVIATTTAAMICVDKKLFNLNDFAWKYIPEFKINGKDSVRILNLLLHNSGLPAFKRFYSFCKNENDVLKNIYESTIEYPTGTKTVYSDLGMITLGKIIEKVSGKSLDKFCRDEIFIPLGMKNTFYNPPKNLINKIAPTEYDNYWRKRQLIGEVHDEAASMLGGVAGHAGLFSNVDDLSVILQMLLQKGQYQGKQFIRKETVEFFIKQYSAESSRAIGWDTNKDGLSSCGKLFSFSSYGHTGYTGTSVWTDPEKKLFVILLTNRVYPTRENTKIIKLRPLIHSAIIDALK